MYHKLSAYPARGTGQFCRENEGKSHLLTFDVLQSIYRRDRRPKIHTTPQGRAARSTWYEIPLAQASPSPSGFPSEHKKN